MKTKLTSLLSTIFILIFCSSNLMGWGTDVIIYPDDVHAQHAIAAKQNGTLYAVVPATLFLMEYGVVYYSSTDNGMTWNNFNPLPSMPTAQSPIIRTKLVVTSLDSVICVYLQSNILYFINVESGVTGQFTTTGVQDFDVAAGSGNFIYTFVQEPNLNTIKRYGTGDGGLTWTGNTATVTSQGFRPRISMSGTRLILNYYGPVLPDTVSSVIRAAFYNESAAGTIAAGTFQDVAVNTSLKRKQFQTVLNNGIAWFIFTEGDVQQVIKCRVSTDDGVTYQPEFVISGDVNINAFWFGATPVINSGTFGVALTWVNDSIAPSTSFDQMYCAFALNAAPGNFTIPAAPLNTYNDTTVTSTATNILPVFVSYNVGLNTESGIAWIGESATGSSLYYDRLSATTGIEQINSVESLFAIYPSPATDFIIVSGKSDELSVSEFEVLTMEGKTLIRIPVQNKNQQNTTSHLIDVSNLSSGNYILKILSNDKSGFKKFTVVK